MKTSKLKLLIEIILVISIIVLIGMIVYDYYDMKKTEDYTAEIVNELDNIIENNKDNVNNNEVAEEVQRQQQTTNKSSKTIEISGCYVYGKIKIDKIGIEYPIIEYENEQSLWKSICKISKNSVDGTGNLCLAGHNMRNLSMFGKLRQLSNGDKVKVTNLYGEEFVYEVYDISYINPEQTEVLKQTDESIITLVTCNDSSTKRLIVKGKLI